jgi:2-dehydro-3-deoxygalactonokinase
MIAVDWGTSSLRAYRLSSEGAVLEQRNTDAGVLASQGHFEAVLAKIVHGWPEATVWMAGMIGSRSGWQEVPYVACPAGFAAVAAGMRQVAAPALPGRRVFIVPGVSDAVASQHPEVMRGEETQVLGLADQLGTEGRHVICLPGTHSKWVTWSDGGIVSLRTAMTGELYALLRRHSLLAALMPAVGEDVDDADAFARGVTDSQRGGVLGNHLFAVRTHGLFGTLAPAVAPSYLSGLLIGHELQGLLPAHRPSVHLIGDAALVQRYRRALALLDVAAATHAPDLCARGLFLLSAQAALAAQAAHAAHAA